jgi:hypothetical protein
LQDNGYGELPITNEYAVAIDSLPLIHKIRSTVSSPKRSLRHHPANDRFVGTILWASPSGLNMEFRWHFIYFQPTNEPDRKCSRSQDGQFTFPPTQNFAAIGQNLPFPCTCYTYQDKFRPVAIVKGTGHPTPKRKTHDPFFTRHHEISL